MRWHHPERGMISPAEFIPVAEEIGLIVPLGEWVLRKACADAATWPPDVKVAVNLSPIQVMNPNLVPVVIGALAASGLPASRLELEITESVLMQNTETTLAALHRLRELGVRISMDDFGTGYSSLSYLRSFPFDKIKIDRCFISGLAGRGRIRSRSCWRLPGSPKNLGMMTTAEGVETAGAAPTGARARLHRDAGISCSARRARSRRSPSSFGRSRKPSRPCGAAPSANPGSVRKSRACSMSA